MQPPSIVSKSHTKENFIFSFDFEMFCGNLYLGEPQAAFPSVKGVATSTPPARKWTDTCRAARICTASLLLTAPRWDIAPRQSMGLRLQARPKAVRAPSAPSQRRGDRIGRAQGGLSPASALFHAQLSALCVCDSTEVTQTKGAQIC